MIKHQTADEMGEVIGAFNEMQVKLAEEARRNREALEHVAGFTTKHRLLCFRSIPMDWS